jgi:hypothetical protein
MPSGYLTGSTNLQAAHFGGQLTTPYVTLWDPLIQTTAGDGQTVQLTAIDEGPDGKVKFLTTAEITGQSVSSLPQSALCRMFCMYVVTHLSEKYLLDACHSLTEIYSWQIGEGRPRPLPNRVYHPVAGVVQRESAPFVYDE